MSTHAGEHLARRGVATPAASVIGQTSKHLPHWVQASAIAATRADKRGFECFGRLARSSRAPWNHSRASLSRFRRRCRAAKFSAAAMRSRTKALMTSMRFAATPAPPVPW